MSSNLFFIILIKLQFISFAYRSCQLYRYYLLSIFGFVVDGALRKEVISVYRNRVSIDQGQSALPPGESVKEAIKLCPIFKNYSSVTFRFVGLELSHIPKFGRLVIVFSKSLLFVIGKCSFIDEVFCFLFSSSG